MDFNEKAFDLTSMAVGLVTAAFSGGAISSLIRAIRHRGKDRVDAASNLSQSAMEVVKTIQAALEEAQQDATEARQSAAAAHRRAEEAREEQDKILRQFSLLRHESELLVYRLRRLGSAIMDETVPREELKAMVQGMTPKGDEQ